LPPADESAQTQKRLGPAAASQCREKEAERKTELTLAYPSAGHRLGTATGNAASPVFSNLYKHTGKDRTEPVSCFL